MFETFAAWVCSRDLPSFRNFGTYMTKDDAIVAYGLIDDDRADALSRINNPKGENEISLCCSKLYQDKLS